MKKHYAQDVVANEWREMLADFARSYLTGEQAEKASAATTAVIQLRQLVERVRIKCVIVLGRLKATVVRPKPAAKQESNG